MGGEAGGISIHAVDVASGRTAAGLRVQIVELGEDGSRTGSERLVADGRVGANGIFDHPSVKGEGVCAGAYEVRFFIGEHYRAKGDKPGILEVAPFRFVIRDAAEHFHLPLKFTAHGYSIYRGA